MATQLTTNQAKLNLPKPGSQLPAGVPLSFAFTPAVPSITANLTLFQQQGNIGGAVSMWVDNSASTGSLSLSFGQSGQTLIVKAGMQGYLHILCPNPIQVTASLAGGGTSTVQVVLLNYSIPSYLWSAV